VLSAAEPETTLGERIVKARQEAGLSPALTAHLAGIKPATLRDWERDRSAPRVNRLVNLAGILGVSPTHLLADEGQSDNPAQVSRGRQQRLLQTLKDEILDIEAQQKALTKRLTATV
jgi:transcriptional regulator with XRE-family HTH domain